MPRVQTSPAVQCPTCKTIVTYGVDAMCYRCGDQLPDDLDKYAPWEVAHIWHREDEPDPD